MESLLDFIKGMDGVTLALIGLGVILVFPVISSKAKDIATSIKSFIKKTWEAKPIIKPVVPNSVDEPPSMTELVTMWEALHDGCAENDLAEACAKLDEVWPLLLPSNNMVVK
jgi:hypothetical protein